MAKIIVTVDKHGKAVVKVEGVKGPSCVTLTSTIEATLGVATSVEPTVEIYEHEEEKERQVRI